MTRDPHVLVVGSGPSGLSCATSMAHAGLDVLVVERDGEPGGVPRHCHHPGFGLQDLHRPMSGPRYAAALVERAKAAGASISTATTVRDRRVDGTVTTVSARGVERWKPEVVVVATGARERPRPARLVPGARPAGIFTTGELQQRVFLYGLSVGRRAVVVGAEHVSFSAVMTLRHAGIDVVAMVTEHAQHQSIAGAALVARTLWRVPILRNSRVASIHGHGRVETIVIEECGTDRTRSLDVDTVVFTGDWIAESSLAREWGAAMTVDRGVPLHDQFGATSLPGVVVVGNVTQPVETAGAAALEGQRIGRHLAQRLDGARASEAVLEIEHDETIEWVAPPRIASGDPPACLKLRSSGRATGRTFEARQDGQLLVTERLRHHIPNRGLSVPSEWLARARSEGGPIEVRLVS